MIFPVLQLRLMSFACPCGELDEDRDARMAAFTLQSIPITWYRKVRDPHATAADTLVHDLTGMRLPSSSTTNYVGFQATLSMIDTTDGPALEIVCNDPQLQDHDIVREGHTTTKRDGGLMYAIQSALTGAFPLVREVVLLKDVDTIASGRTGSHTFGFTSGRVQCDLKVYAKPEESSAFYGTGRTDGTSSYGYGHKLLQLDVLDSVEDDALSKSMNADELLQHLNSMINWDRRANADFSERYQQEQRRIEECQEWNNHHEEIVYYGDEPPPSQEEEQPAEGGSMLLTSFHSGNSIVAPFKEIWT
uniref:Uncharacterized protein n=1 Tax=Asterionellopsis glacialis TaxID=33640 RepID=A0A7S0PVH0_9STRA